jgi:hypothetical protein
MLSRCDRVVVRSSWSFIPFLATLIINFLWPIGLRPIAIVFVAVTLDLVVVIAERRSPDIQKTFRSSFNHYILLYS